MESQLWPWCARARQGRPCELLRRQRATQLSEVSRQDHSYQSLYQGEGDNAHRVLKFRGPCNFFAKEHALNNIASYHWLMLDFLKYLNLLADWAVGLGRGPDGVAENISIALILSLPQFVSQDDC